MRKIILAAALILMHILPAAGQKASVSTNLIDYAFLGTFNVEASYSLSQYCTITVGAKLNPFTFRAGDPDRQFQYRQQSYSLGARIWPWHSYSGWWLAGRLRYQEYNHGGILSSRTEEGDRIGLCMAAGYTLMVSRHFNVEFGLGLWGGTAWYRKYSCPICGLTIENGRKWFLLPDDLIISLAYVF